MGYTAMSNAAPQHLQALQHANRVRLARARLKRKVAASDVSAAEVVLNCPWEAASMDISDLLMSQRRWGQTRCRKLLAELPMSEKKTVGSMTERQRQTLAALLASAERGRAWRASSWSAHGLTRA